MNQPESCADVIHHKIMNGQEVTLEGVTCHLGISHRSLHSLSCFCQFEDGGRENPFVPAAENTEQLVRLRTHPHSDFSPLQAPPSHVATPPGREAQNERALVEDF